MQEGDRFKERYETGNTPWDIGKPDVNLIQTVANIPIQPCKALEVGCGTGDNAIWLSQQHFEVLGIDSSGIAIDKAKQKALKAGAASAFHLADIFKDQIEGAPFGFAFDRGCFHTVDSEPARDRFAERLSELLTDAGLWLSLLGNADEQRDGRTGPPQRTARDIVNAVEPYFEILSLVSGHFGSNRPDPARAWICLMQKRGKSESR
ncbi:MAG TPA: class I SAM-dependent methyltransferase [Bryobacteraceae bacterium]|nr:class I SAM-dependent methyltransferase [Bryobacteraceae bacterium]